MDSGMFHVDYVQDGIPGVGYVIAGTFTFGEGLWYPCYGYIGTLTGVPGAVGDALLRAWQGWDPSVDQANRRAQTFVTLRETAAIVQSVNAYRRQVYEKTNCNWTPTYAATNRSSTRSPRRAHESNDRRRAGAIAALTVAAGGKAAPAVKAKTVTGAVTGPGGQGKISLQVVIDKGVAKRVRRIEVTVPYECDNGGPIEITDGDRHPARSVQSHPHQRPPELRREFARPRSRLERPGEHAQ